MKYVILKLGLELISAASILALVGMLAAHFMGALNIGAEAPLVVVFLLSIVSLGAQAGSGALTERVGSISPIFSAIFVILMTLPAGFWLISLIDRLTEVLDRERGKPCT